MIRDSLAWLLIIFIEATIVSLCLSTTWIKSQIDIERKEITHYLGYEETYKVITRANRDFTDTFKKTGIISFSYRLFIPDSKATASNNVDFSKLGKYVDLFSDRLDAFWLTIYQCIQRFSLFTIWLPYVLPLLIPCIIDGLMIREIKKTNYGYSNSVRYHAAMHGVVSLIFLPVFYMFLPIAIPPYIVPVWIFLTSLTILLLMANLQQQL